MRYCKKTVNGKICNGLTDVTDSRYCPNHDTTRRRRVCRDCGDTISTLEVQFDFAKERSDRMKKLRRRQLLALEM
jgi:transcriptional regulator NrdR family protein